MQNTSAAALAGMSLATLLVLTPSGYGQTACANVDDMPAARAAVVASAEQASPEAVAAFAELVASRPFGRIVGGHPTLITDNPWQIAMVRAVVSEPTRSQFCGGSIVANDWILTAAHCVQNAIVREDPTRVDVVAGTSQYGIGGERLKVAAVHTHPGYNSSTMDNDFALLQLQSPMTMGQIVAMVDAKAEVADGTEACVSGWGATFEGGPGAIDLLGATVPTVSNTVCNEPQSYNGDILPSMLCAGLEAGGVDSCQGDSGGPLTAMVGDQITLIGVVSWGEGCARKLKYGVYSRVTTAADWIATTMGGN